MTSTDIVDETAAVVERLLKLQADINSLTSSGVIKNPVAGRMLATAVLARDEIERLSRERDETSEALQGMAMYARLGLVEGVVYGCGSHADILRKSDAILLRREIDAERSPAVSRERDTGVPEGWHPIETGIAELADDTLVIVGCTQGFLDIWCGQYLREEKEKQDRGTYRGAPHLAWFPTHWMPRPGAPGSAAPQPPSVSPDNFSEKSKSSVSDQAGETAGQKILRGLQDAHEGNFASITIDGQTWVKRDQVTSLSAELVEARKALEVAEAILANAPDFETTNGGSVPLVNTRQALAKIRAALSPKKDTDTPETGVGG